MRSLAPAALAVLLAASAPAAAQSARPTPNQMLDTILRPVQDQLVQLTATDAERRDVADLISRGEAIAADVVAARQHGDDASVQALGRQITLLARLIRGRIEASRLEVQAAASEQAALVAEDRRVQARAALERSAEQGLESERQTPQPAVPHVVGGASPATPAPSENPATSGHSTTTSHTRPHGHGAGHGGTR